jgi:uncharacterized protein YcbK (DUF882 family)
MNRSSFSTSRRRLFTSLLGLPVAMTDAGQAAGPAAERSLAFYHTHTDEQLSVTYFAEGSYVADSLLRIDHLLRDFRTGEIHSIDADLLDTLHILRQMCGGGTFEVISAYRSPATNAMLQARTDGVAANSLHLQGRAIDVRLTGYDTARLRDAAIGLGRGGVGYYPVSDFVHLDTGRVRAW